MKFSGIHSNEDVIETLVRMVDTGRVPHAILFCEDDGGDAFGITLAFLQYLYCRGRVAGDSCGICPECNKVGKLIHPDVHFIFPTAGGKNVLSSQYIPQLRTLASANPRFTESELVEAAGADGKNSMIAVGEAKALLADLSLSAVQGGYRTAVVLYPEKMNAEASNKLLKILEEPSPQTLFVLITHKPEKVLQTVASRCQRIRIRPSDGIAGVGFSDPSLLDALMNALIAGDLTLCLEAADRIAALPSRDSAKAFCHYFADMLRQMFLSRQGISCAGAVCDKAAAWASACTANFPRKALEVTGRTQMLIDRNVNLKILFTDMADRLYLIIR